jgi:site-specific DNA recombinase
MASIPDADLTGVYCRKSRKGDKQQVTVNRPKRLALQDCNELGLTVKPQNVFIDNGASAWMRNRKRPGWDALLQAARRGEIKHIVCYHPDRLMRQPRDLEELLSISDEYGITLYGRVNARNQGPRWQDAAAPSTGARVPTARTATTATGPCEPNRWKNS